MKDPVDDLVVEASRRAVEAATVLYKREPTVIEASLILIQAQVAMLTATLLGGDEMEKYWANVIKVIRGRTSESPASELS